MAMRFDEILGQERAIATLRATLREGRIPNAYLFEGPWGVGKTRTALALAAALVCRTEGDEACGECPACVRAARFQHPDVRLLFPVMSDEDDPESIADRAAGRGRRPAPRLHLREGGLDPHRPHARPAARAGVQALRGAAPRRRAARRRPHARGPVLGDAQDARGARREHAVGADHVAAQPPAADDPLALPARALHAAARGDDRGIPARARGRAARRRRGCWRRSPRGACRAR